MAESGLNVFSGNRLENLGDALVTVLDRPFDDPFQSEMIIVQSRGMAKWISLHIASGTGLCANIDYKFPNAFVYDVLNGYSHEKTALSFYDPSVMTWKLMSVLPQLVGDDSFSQLENYLENGCSHLRLYQLASLIADTFDQYLLFRPEMMTAWDKGEENHWQAKLWRTVNESHDTRHRVALLEQFRREAESGAMSEKWFPERVNVFGISSLPEFHMEIFRLLSTCTQVNLFLLNPCQEYWGDILLSSELRKLSQEADNNDMGALHIHTDNRLLSSMGGLGREFFDLLNTIHHDEYPIFEVPEQQTLLGHIQTDICHLNEGSFCETENATVNDGSVEIHSCHSAMRETEVLYDAILNMIHEDSSLKPRDILVMTPDIEVFSPLVKSVFETTDSRGTRLPYSIADRTMKNESRIAETFLNLLDFSDSRYAVSDVMGILENENVLAKFGFIESDLESINGWIQEASIRWGRDGMHREHMGMPFFEQNSWKAGLDRLFLGYALPGNGSTLYQDLLPVNSIEGEASVALGNVSEFIRSLFRITDTFSKAQSHTRWNALLMELLETFFVLNDTTQNELQMLRDEINSLYDEAGMSGFDSEIDVSVIKNYFEHKLGAKSSGNSFLSGGITFCEMLPMRSIPFRVICIIGMNSDLYPRQSRFPGFDLMSRFPKAGDRSRRKDDRYLFLEVLLSARDKLYISYTGQSSKDNSAIQPSVLVSELIDYINEVCRISETGDGFETIHHPLQAFSYRYFNGESDRLFSFSENNFKAAMENRNTKQPDSAFITNEIPLPETKYPMIDIASLSIFFQNPAKYLLQERFGIAVDYQAVSVREDEPFKIDGLFKYGLSQTLIDRQLQNTPEGDYYPIAKATGALPYGEIGYSEYNTLENDVAGFANRMKEWFSEKDQEHVDARLSLNTVSLFGTIDNVYANRLIHYRYAPIKGRDYLRFWVPYLALKSLEINGTQQYDGLLAGVVKKGSERIWAGMQPAAVEEPTQILGRLAELYMYGLTKPLHFFPETSFVYAHEMINGSGKHDKALVKAAAAWEGNDRVRGEGTSNPFYSICFRAGAPLDEVFIEQSMTVYEPVLTCLKKIG